MARAQLGNGQADTRGPTTMETRTDNGLGLGGMRRGRGATMAGRGLSHISRCGRCGGEAERECQMPFATYQVVCLSGYGSTLRTVEHEIAGLPEWRSARDYLVCWYEVFAWALMS